VTHRINREIYPDHGLKGRKKSLEHRLKLSRAQAGKEPMISPYLPDGVLIRFERGRWKMNRAGRAGEGGKMAHARGVWEHFNGPVPEGFRVHHKSGDPATIESDRLENLMLLSNEWNLKFMPDLAVGFGIPESWVTTEYLQVENLPYEQRFPEVCRRLLTKI